MVDVCDEADKHIEDAVNAGVAQARQRATHMRPMGQCYFCWEDVGEGKLFCDPVDGNPEDSCAADYEREAAARRRNGG